MKAQRVVWGETLAELAAADERVIVLDGDLATSTRADIVDAAVPGSFIQVGIAEQNMVGMAFGLSTMGYRPWLSTFGVFLTHRALDQVRMLVSQTRAPVRLAAAYSGLLNGSSGKTHQDIQDFAIMRTMPYLTVIAPADEFEAEAVTRWAAEFDGPVYIRFARDAVAPVFDGPLEFVPGAPRVVREGAGPLLISTGVQTSRTVAAAELLSREGIDAKVVHLATLKPVDEALLDEQLAGREQVFTVEEHSVLNGLGGLISERVTQRGAATQVVRIGLEDRWSESAPNDFLLDKYGLSAERVAEQVRRRLPLDS